MAVMFHFQTLDVFLPLAYSLAVGTGGELAGQLRRAALSINLNITEGTGRLGRDERLLHHRARVRV